MKMIEAKDIIIQSIVSELKAGATVVYPTETCYGLGCDATNYQAVAKVFAIKRRPVEKSALVLMADIAMAREYVVWNNTIDKLAAKYWPGPLTIVADAREREAVLPPGVMGPDGLVAFRLSSYPLAAAICKELGQPVVSTSANIAGEENPYDSEAVLEMFTDRMPQPDIVIDTGALPERKPSTVVRLVGGAIEVFRQGTITISN